MGQLIGVSIGGPYVELVVVVVVLVVAVVLRVYMMRNPGRMHAKCKKCGAVFDASNSLSMFHIGPLKLLKCPACDKTSLMKAYVKDQITWPTENKMQEQPSGHQFTNEELEQKRIEESKYERS
jgi:hypothetical protein